MDGRAQRASEQGLDGGAGPGSARGLALAYLFGTYGFALERFFARRVAVTADAPDLVQEVFLRLSRLPDPAAIEKPRHFLFVTAANLLKDRARRDIAHAAGRHGPLPGERLAGAEIPPDRVVESREAAERLHAVLRDLPERTRIIFVLRVLDGMKMADVAHALGISTRAAEKHQAKARARVAAALTDWRPH